MKSKNKRRIIKWVLPFVIPESACLIFFIYSFINHNTTYCEAAGILAMIYVWVYTIICAVILPYDFTNKKNSKTKDSTSKKDKD